MKKRTLLAAIAAATLSLATVAQESNPPAGPGYGRPGMGGYGPGAMPGYGPGMMQGMGPGAMGGYGPGMMQGMGPGAMGGYGPGMMQGMGPGMMGDDGTAGPIGMLDLSEQQRKQVAELMGRQRSEQFERTGRMRELMGKLQRLYADETWDADAIGNTYDQLFRLQRERIVSMVRAHNKVRGLLTDEQRRQLAAVMGPMGMGRGMGPGMMGRGMGPTNQPKPPAGAKP